MFTSGYVGNWDKMSGVGMRTRRAESRRASARRPPALRSTRPRGWLARNEPHRPWGNGSFTEYAKFADLGKARSEPREGERDRAPAPFNFTQAVPIAFTDRTFSRAPCAVIGAFTSRPSPSRPGAGFAEMCPGMPPNGKLVFNIRISTEAEINGTVKGDV
ncbi:hypothetical protein IVB14_31965 [Bradyrhizobium sp. 180]|uniref:hypothetical protein n=1 Tax=unclassified Bradyrhizobium TaxID=2631580 RepID=UPI001FF7D94A|nr:MULTISPECIES: hypothetical protein [unclassified Bradyrhizobium]MCK1494904.1 hypothetical protein [Bradyrhizobium sp. 180]MCK1667977.1 hypothetical protein [Bradyrhizobium sp. 153]